MATIVNARDVLLQAATTRFVPPPISGTIDFANVTGATKPADNATVGADWGINLSGKPVSLGGINAVEGSKLASIQNGADVTLSAIGGGLMITGGGITLQGGGAIKGGQTDYAQGNGFFLGYSATKYKFSIGNTSQYLLYDGTNVTMSGSLELRGTTGLTLTNSWGAVGKISVDSNGDLTIQSTNYNKHIALLGPTSGGLTVDDFTQLGTIVTLTPPVGTSQLNLRGIGNMIVESFSGALSLKSGTFGLNPLTLTFGAGSTASNSLVSGLNAEYLGGYTLAMIQGYVSTNYCPISVPIGNIAAGVQRTAYYSTDGGANWTTILFKF